MMKNLLTFLILLCLSAMLRSQSSYLLHHMPWVPQSMHSNPAVRPEFKGYVGFPALSGLYFEYNHGLALDDVFQKDGDSLLFDPGFMISNLKEHNRLDLALDEELFSFGFSLRNDIFLHFSATEKFRTRFAYPRNLLEFLWKGNGAFLGEERDLSGLGIEALSYSELAAGVSFPFGRDLVFGGRLKYLAGRAYASAEANAFSIYTDPQDYSIRVSSGMESYSAGADILIGDEFDANLEPPVFGSANMGLAVDLAACWALDSLITVSAGLTDLGYIRWETHARRHYVKEGSYEFSGLELGDMFGDTDGAFDEQLQDIADTLEQIFDLQEENGAFTRMMRPGMFVSGEYRLGSKTIAGGLIRAEMFNSALQPSASLSLHHRLGKVMSVSANYTYKNHAFSNIGAGVVFKFGPVQLYMLSDNILGPMVPGQLRMVNFQLGLNFRFGKYQPVVAAEESPAEAVPATPVVEP
ncbi:MAG TPA: DUF5723 family protein [Bacteroidales bacterium]|nr:DUF5723 family protein [Bacteroidales bacterium]HRZ76485.1 DUF5723 family protein [Bacteroidales bacterium]